MGTIEGLTVRAQFGPFILGERDIWQDKWENKSYKESQKGEIKLDRKSISCIIDFNSRNKGRTIDEDNAKSFGQRFF